MYNLSLGLEPCFCNLISRLWLHRDVTDQQQSFLHLPFLCRQRNQTETVPSWWLYWNFGVNYQRSPPWPGASFLHIKGFHFLSTYVVLRRSQKILSVVYNLIWWAENSRGSVSSSIRNYLFIGHFSYHGHCCMTPQWPTQDYRYLKTLWYERALSRHISHHQNGGASFVQVRPVQRKRRIHWRSSEGK